MPENNDSTTLQPGTRGYDLSVSATNQPIIPSPRQQDMTAPDIGASTPAPAQAPQVGAPPAKPNPQQQAAAADVAHHSMLGRAVNFLLGKQRQYVPGPDGTPVPVDVPQKPGELFRHILASAIIGGAAGQGTNSPIAGFTRGATAGIQANMQADAQKRAQAQRDFENRQAAERQTHEQSIADQRLADEKLRTEAQIQLHNIQTIAEEHNLNLRDREYADKFNQHQGEIRQQTYDAGGIDAPIPGNGEVGNGAKLQKLRISQPAMFQAPSGYHTVYTTDINYDGLNNDPKKGWVDENGNAIDLASRTTHFVQFVPHDAMKEPVTLKGSKVKKLRPDLSDLVEDDKEYTMPREHWFGVISSARKQAHDEARQDWREKHDEINRQLSEMKDRADNLTRQINTLSRNPVPDDDTKRQIEDLTAQRQQVWDDYDAAQAQAHPNSRLRKQTIRLEQSPTPRSDAEKALVSSLNPGEIAIRLPNGRTGKIPAAQEQKFLNENKGAVVFGRSQATDSATLPANVAPGANPGEKMTPLDNR